MSTKCNHKCFECKFSDCINDVITRTEKCEANKRDADFIEYGRLLKQRPNRAKHRYNR